MAKMENAQSTDMVKFSFYPWAGKNPVSIAASPFSSLGDAVRSAEFTGKKLENFSFKDHILFGEVKDYPGQVAILPNILCGALKPNGKVLSQRKKDGTPFPKSDGEKADHENNVDKENEAPSIPIVFFVKVESSGITKLCKSAYDGKPLCLIAHDKETFKDVLLKDGRFSCDQEVSIFEDNDRNSEVPPNYSVSNYVRTYTGIFTLKKRGQKRKAGNLAPGEGSMACETPTRDIVYSSMPASLEEPFTEEMGRSMIKDARNSFGHPGCKEDRDKYIQSTVKKFGKMSSSSMPAESLTPITQASYSVGYIQCGDVKGTCSLVSYNAIITNQHILQNINGYRAHSTDRELFGTIRVSFNYWRPHQSGNFEAEVDESVSPITSTRGLDFVILFLKPSPILSSLCGLGCLVRRALPQDGLIMLVGHPGGERKKFETCRIIPEYNWHATLCSRATEAEHFCEQHPDQCQLNFTWKNILCIHYYKGQYYEGNHPHQLPYDTSFFHGASGSPVFNSDGHIIAMHTQGYPVYRDSKKISLMEFGVTFNAIYQDVKEEYGEEVARQFFPEAES